MEQFRKYSQSFDNNIPKCNALSCSLETKRKYSGQEQRSSEFSWHLNESSKRSWKNIRV